MQRLLRRLRLPLLACGVLSVGCLVSGAVWGAGAADSDRVLQFPFVGQVGAEGAVLRCGPGERFYATGALTSAEEVTVYRRAPGGWLAIRPPEGSFSWIRNEDLREHESAKTAEVVRDGAVAWVGTSRGEQHDRWQVRLHLGEMVRLIGPAERRSMHGRPADWWRRIAPPPGEFRWIRERDLQLPPGRVQLASAQTEAAANEPAEPKKEAIDSATGKSAEKSEAPDTLQADQQAKPLIGDAAGKTLQRLEEAFTKLDSMVKPTQHGQWRKRGGSEAISGPETNASPREVRFRNRKQDASRERRERVDAEELPEPSSTTDAWGDELSEEELADPVKFHQALKLLDAEVSLMVSRPVATWQLNHFKARAQQLSKHGPSALDRGRAALLLDTIQNFDELYVRHLALRDAATVVVPASTRREPRTLRDVLGSRTEAEELPAPFDDSGEVRITRVTGADGNEPASDTEQEDRDNSLNGDRIDGGESEEDYRRPTGSGIRRGARLDSPDAAGAADRQRSQRYHYDAEGVLKRVTSERRIAPPYALVNEQGDIVALVKPSPGLNLQAYLGQHVGMYGPQRTLPSFRKTLLTAERVVRMDRVR